MNLFKQNDLLFVVISAFIVSVIWIGVSVYHSYAASTITETQSIQVTPINPHFQKGIIEVLKNKPTVEPLFESNGASAPVASVSSTLVPTTTQKISSPSATKVTP